MNTPFYGWLHDFPKKRIGDHYGLQKGSSTNGLEGLAMHLFW